MLDQIVRGHRQAKHLSFDGSGRERMGSDLPAPGSGAVDDFGALKLRLDGFGAGGATFGDGHIRDFVAAGEIHAAVLGSFPCCGAEGSWIDAALFQVESPGVFAQKCRFEVFQQARDRMVGKECGVLLGMLLGGK